MSPLIRCRKCPATHAITVMPLTDLDAAFAELLAAGWLHFAWKGRGRERWAWECAACKPKPSTGGRGAPFSGHRRETLEVAEDLSAIVTDAVKDKGLENARVGSKVNAHGELVVALIVPPRYDGQWEP